MSDDNNTKSFGSTFMSNHRKIAPIFKEFLPGGQRIALLFLVLTVKKYTICYTTINYRPLSVSGELASQMVAVMSSPISLSPTY
jgi:hypothetical protein